MEKGFTLIELLAVILILGIIALIATPRVMDMVEESRIEVGKQSVINYIHTVDDTIISSGLSNNPIDDGMYSKSALKNKGVEIKNDINSAIVEISGGEVISGQFCANNKSYTYSNNSVEYQEYQDYCVGNNKVLFSKIYNSTGSSTQSAILVSNDGELYGFGATSSILSINQIWGKDYEVPKPTKIETNIKFKKIEISTNKAVFGLTESGDLYTWGYDDPHIIRHSTDTYDYVGIEKVAGDTKFIDVTSYYYTVYALDTDSNLWVWSPSGGGDDISVYGYGYSSIPPTIIESNTGLKEIRAMRWGGYGIDEDGYLWTWGKNNYGTLANGLLDYNPSKLAKSSSNIRFKKLGLTVQNNNFASAIDVNGDVYTWGAYPCVCNLCDNFSLPHKVLEGKNIIKYADTSYYGMALSEDGKVYVSLKGDTNFNEIHFSNPIVDISLMDNGYGPTFYAIDNTGEFYSWGGNDKGTLGMNIASTYYSWVKTSRDYKYINSRFYITNNNELYLYSDIGISAVNPVKIAGEFSSVSGSSPAVMLDINGNLSYDYVGSDGAVTGGFYDTSYHTYTFTNPRGTILSNIKYYEVSSNAIFAIDNDGYLWYWGCNDYGHFGIGSSRNCIQTAAKVSTTKKYIKTYFAGRGAFILDENHVLYAAGSNSYGDLGLPNKTQYDTFTQVLTNVVDMNREYAITSDGKLYKFTTNSFMTFTNDVKIKAFTTHYYIDENDYLYAMTSKNGEYTMKKMIDKKVKKETNYYIITQSDELYYYDYATDKLIKEMDNVKDVITLNSTTFVIKTDNSVYAKGYNDSKIIVQNSPYISKPTLVEVYE